MSEENHIDELINFIKNNITKIIVEPALSQTPEIICLFRDRLHVLHHYCLQSSISENIQLQVEEILDTSGIFWRLLSENLANLNNLADYARVRILGAEAEGLTNLEEIISGEDTMRDIMINSVAFYLNWLSNSIWIDSAKKDRVGLVKSYYVELQDKIWKFIKDNTKNQDLPLERIIKIGKQTELLMRTFNNNSLSSDIQLAFQIQLFVLILRLQTGKLLLDLENLKEESE